MRITNFGGNVSFVPKHFYTPQNEAEVLDILNRHREGKVRVVASGHAWSDIVKSDDVIVDMRHFNSVAVTKTEGGQVWVKAGAGCVLQRLLDIVHKETDATLPSMGGIKKQTISGIISTATHGSGRPSLSHYMAEIRVAAYDSTGKAKIYEWKEGEDGHLAARCAIGCMGIILSVKFQCVPKYYVAQNSVRRPSLDAVRAGEKEFELQQFILMPYSWQYFVTQRKVVFFAPQGLNKVRTYIARAYNLIGVDVFLHLVLSRMVALFPSSQRGTSRPIIWFYKTLLPRITEQKGMVTDFSENAITLHHDLFRHLEMEIFVRAENIDKAVDLIRSVTSVFAGLSPNVSPDVEEELKKIEMLATVMAHVGEYTHHYPIYFRFVLPDDTLISMTAGANETYYSISFFTYLAPGERENFYIFVKTIARCLTRLYEARLHWGKYFPLAHEDIKHLYPRLEEFRQICDGVDPNGVFRNEYTSRVLGFGQSN